MEQKTSTGRKMNQPDFDGMVSPPCRFPLPGDSESTSADHASESLAAKAGWDDTEYSQSGEGRSGPTNHSHSPVNAEEDDVSADTAAKSTVDADTADPTADWGTTKYGPGYSDDENEIDYAKGECYNYQDGEYYGDYDYDYDYAEGQEGEYTPEDNQEEEYPYGPFPWIIERREHIKRLNAIDREQWQRDSDEFATQRATYEEDEAYYKEDAAFFCDEQDLYVHAYYIDGERDNHDYILFRGHELATWWNELVAWQESLLAKRKELEKEERRLFDLDRAILESETDIEHEEEEEAEREWEWRVKMGYERVDTPEPSTWQYTPLDVSSWERQVREWEEQKKAKEKAEKEKEKDAEYDFCHDAADVDEQESTPWPDLPSETNNDNDNADSTTSAEDQDANAQDDEYTWTPEGPCPSCGLEEQRAAISKMQVDLVARLELPPLPEKRIGLLECVVHEDVEEEPVQEEGSWGTEEPEEGKDVAERLAKAASW